jgi:hypothetical protein
MNERIRQLAEQANELDYETFDEYNHKTVHHYKFDKEKFAELIVRECMQVCKKTEQYEVGNQDPVEVGCIRAGAVFCREEIREHFGVEE